ncbi:MAG: hypothetical protein FWG94_06270 [Oscillospiraceae bacterium]|nr:hypothetical protein [Oscillospiraceae bacterium]
MQYFMVYMTMAVTAFAVENAAFTRGLGLSKATLLLNSRWEGLIYGVVTTWMLVLSSFPVSLVNYYLLDVTFIRAIRAPLYLLCVLASYVVTYILVVRFFPKFQHIVAAALPISAFNTALFGAFYVSGTQRFTFFETTGYALGTGLGYTIALLVIYYARKRLAISPVPRAFRGLPILLVYIGLLSLAIYGLIGHELPI